MQIMQIRCVRHGLSFQVEREELAGELQEARGDLRHSVGDQDDGHGGGGVAAAGGGYQMTRCCEYYDCIIFIMSMISKFVIIDIDGVVDDDAFALSRPNELELRPRVRWP